MKTRQIRSSKTPADKPKILVLGGQGFIGTHIVNLLRSRQLKVSIIAHAIDTNQTRHKDAQTHSLDLKKPTSQEHYETLLKNIDVVINAAGILKPSKKSSQYAPFEKNLIAFFKACVTHNVEKIIHLSAFGIEKKPRVGFAQSKQSIDKALLKLPITTLILRPSLVYGGTSGGNGLLRALSVLPLIPIPNQGNNPFYPIHVEELSQIIVDLIEKKRAGSKIINVLGPGALSLPQILTELRHWHGLKKPKFVRLPNFISKPILTLATWLNHPTFNETTQAMLESAPKTISSKHNLYPQSKIMPLAQGLSLHPATSKDLALAKYYFIPFLLQILIGLFWATTSINLLFAASDGRNTLLQLSTALLCMSFSLLTLKRFHLKRLIPAQLIALLLIYLLVPNSSILTPWLNAKLYPTSTHHVVLKGHLNGILST